MPKPTPLADPLNAPAYDRVRQRIVDDIISGHWPMGAPITMAALIERYAISQMPIREALQSLRGEGVLDISMHRGARVPEVDPGYVDNLYDIRAAVEAMLAERAAERIDADGVARLRQLQAEFEAAARDGEADAALACNRLFHRAINAWADNPQALAVMEGRANLVYAVRRRYGYGPVRLERVIEQHRAILDALAAGDAAAAGAATRRHCLAAKADLLTLMKQEPR